MNVSDPVGACASPLCSGRTGCMTFKVPSCWQWWGMGLAALALSAEAAPERPIPAIEHVVILSVDGLRPDCLLLANTPTFRALIHESAYTFWAKTTAVSVTLPSHVSMLTGVKPDRHGITWNYRLPFSEPVFPKVPTIMELATTGGYVTALVAGKAKFAVLNKPGAITHASVPTEQVTDAVAVAEAISLIERYQPGLIMIHFPELDAVGHAKGWGSHEQLLQLENTDRQLARVLAALERTGLRAKTLMIVTADHGGAGLSHGAEDARSRHIPWIVNGPGVKKFFDLTGVAKLEVNTEDTFATAAYVLGLPLPAGIDGKPVVEAFETAR